MPWLLAGEVPAKSTWMPSFEMVIAAAKVIGSS